jgi:hypothetical protein
MSLELDEHASRRAELLAPVKELCAAAGVTTETGLFPPSRFGGKRPPVLALRHVAADESWDASVTVVRARRVPPSARRAAEGTPATLIPVTTWARPASSSTRSRCMRRMTAAAGTARGRWWHSS